ncbi:unnamed protein product [Spirodela intermedia]|uniref:Uncharacterized protein n=1 Tax=Spirodela intermedia TaxID=51605 RepID=A0A7I8IGY0_SPIIN|nr:unnamed protein product [Spirodela intermedia]CAA6657143.1 unnamed protein product [Spirodela intermedia]
MGRRIVFGGCHSIERKLATLRLSNGCHPTEELDGGGACGASSSGLHSKRRLFIASSTLLGENDDFAALRRLSPDGEELDGGGARVRENFILRSAQQGEALHRIWYALKRWRLVSQ